VADRSVLPAIQRDTVLPAGNEVVAEAEINPPANPPL